jgi:spore coat protein SA
MICTEKLPVPPIAGGAVQLYIEGIVPYLSREHDITVFSIQYPGLPDLETVDNVRYIRVPGGSGLVYAESLKAALDNSYDLVHVFNRPKVMLALMEEFPALRFGLSLHNEMFHPEKMRDADALKCIDRAEYINTVSRYIADTVSSRFPSAAGKLRVVYSGVDAGRFKPVWTKEAIRSRDQLKAKLGLQGFKVVLFVGRLSIKKGVDVLLRAMAPVMRQNPKTALVVVGSKWYGKNESDDYTKSLQSKIQDLPGPVVFTGFVPPAGIAAYYALGDVFVCASQWMEPLARVHYEAMAAGLPIITTNRGGNAEVVGGYGNGIVLEEYKNPEAMAQKISYVLTHEEEALKMGNNGRRLAEQRYTWERVAGEVFQGMHPAEPSKAKAEAKEPPVVPPSKEMQDFSILLDMADAAAKAVSASYAAGVGAAVKSAANAKAPVKPAVGWRAVAKAAGNAKASARTAAQKADAAPVIPGPKLLDKAPGSPGFPVPGSSSAEYGFQPFVAGASASATQQTAASKKPLPPQAGAAGAEPSSRTARPKDYSTGWPQKRR